MDSGLGSLPLCDGIRYPKFPALVDGGIEDHFNDIQNFKSQESDIIICTYPKAGSHWIYEMVSMIIHYKADTNLESIKDFRLMQLMESRKSNLEETSSSRIINTHIRLKYLPKEHIAKKRKIVHMIRNPKDVMVSMFWHFRQEPLVGLVDVQWEEFFDIWMSGRQPYGSWYDYELEMKKAEIENPGMIYTLSYEDAKQNPTEEIKKLANFLDLEYSDDIAEKIAEATSFANMKKENRSKVTRPDGTSNLFRKGVIGDWKNIFTVAQNERFEAQYNERMTDAN